MLYEEHSRVRIAALRRRATAVYRLPATGQDLVAKVAPLAARARAERVVHLTRRLRAQGFRCTERGSADPYQALETALWLAYPSMAAISVVLVVPLLSSTTISRFLASSTARKSLATALSSTSLSGPCTGVVQLAFEVLAWI
ncbi:hypothetical protein [Amycolatopsis decaplanina]|uniref:Uncharacterized protein n=1 Tax=Amycolatopsis decaplanina DSM 44594 TaxID=1284240 RepID=M2YQY0_9PSEU|nr:hypothetical protein [Amycolatopsis decaplanina]EME51178.1 hypothetical protein H074_37073 [Amycolatopsis decaplanina DSM 44594]